MGYAVPKRPLGPFTGVGLRAQPRVATGHNAVANPGFGLSEITGRAARTALKTDISTTQPVQSAYGGCMAAGLGQTEIILGDGTRERGGRGRQRPRRGPRGSGYRNDACPEGMEIPSASARAERFRRRAVSSSSRGAAGRGRCQYPVKAHAPRRRGPLAVRRSRVLTPRRLGGGRGRSERGWRGRRGRGSAAPHARPRRGLGRSWRGHGATSGARRGCAAGPPRAVALGVGEQRFEDRPARVDAGRGPPRFPMGSLTRG